MKDKICYKGQYGGYIYSFIRLKKQHNRTYKYTVFGKNGTDSFFHAYKHNICSCNFLHGMSSR